MMAEFSYAFRRLARDPWSACAAVLIGALGAGLNTAVFAFAYGVLLRPLPYRDPARLVVTDASIPFARVDDWRRQLTSFEHIGAYSRDDFVVRGLDVPRFLPVAIVSDEFFETLGSPTVAGRTFGAQDSGDVAVVSERLARQLIASTGDLVGRSISVGDTPTTIVGVMPDAFAVPSGAIDVWIPARVAPAVHYDSSRDQRRARLVGRLAPGVSVAKARSDLARVRAALEPEGTRQRTPELGITSLRDQLVGDSRRVLLVFLAAAALVLVIACANIATILIGRTIARRGEFAIRSAIGSSPASMFLTVLSESVLIALAAGLLGLGIALAAVRIISASAAAILPRTNEVRLDWPLLGFAVLVASVSAILAALPAWRSIDRSAATLRSAMVAAPAGQGIRALLGALQVALAVVLLGAGALLVRTVEGLLHTDIGVDPRGVIVTRLTVTASTSFNASGREAWLQGLLRSVRATRDVRAGAGSSMPPDKAQLEMTVRLDDDRGERTFALSATAVTPGFLEALGVPLVQGRYFDESDVRNPAPVTVLSASAARDLMPAGNPAGKQLPIKLPGMRDRGYPTVVGVVRDVKYTGLESRAGAAIYVLWKEVPAGQLYLVVRAPGNPTASMAALRTSLRGFDSRMPVMPIQRLDDVVEHSVADRRLRALLGGSVAFLASAIALVGLAAGVGRMVTERRRELAIRAALGATPSRALLAVMIDGGLVAVAGVIAGTFASVAGASALRAFVFGISPRDPMTLGAVAVTVVAASLAACYLPARRAAMANPIEILRGE